MSHSNFEETEPLLTDARTPNDPDDEETLRGSSNFGGTSSEPPQPRAPRTREAPRDHTNFLPLRHGKFTRLEIMLAFTCLLLLILMSIFAGLYGPCLTPDCVLIAGKIIEDMDQTADPCEDFFQYSCGGWLKKHIIPDDKGRYGYFDILYEENQELLKRILEEDDFPSIETAGLPSPSVSIDKKNFYNLQSFYKSCMNEDHISQLGGAPLVPILNRLFENFPVENRFSLFNNFGHQLDNLQQAAPLDLLNLTNTLSNLSTIDVQPLLGFYVDADAKNPKENVLYLSQSGLVLPSKEYYEEEHIMVTYKSVMAELLGRALDNRSNFIIEMGYTISNDAIEDIYEYSIERFWLRGWEEIADKIIEFEKALAKISLSPEDFNDPEATYNKHTIKSLEKLSPTFFWSHYISSLLPPTIPDLPSKIILTSNQYFENLSNLVRKTPPPILQAYFAWQIIARHANSLDEKFQAPLRRLKAKLRGVDENVKPKRWEVCLSSVDQTLGRSIDIANQMIDSIKDAFVDRLPDLDWLDAETREKAIEKVDAIIQKVGYPIKSPNTTNPRSLQDYYRDIKFDEDNYFDNLLSSYLWGSEKQWKELGQPVNRYSWYMSPQTVNAYYNPTVNEIVFPAGILQFPFFSSKAPEYINYGAIGTVIGHELTHGFDNNGRQYDATGRLIQWWSNATVESFKEKAECFVNQYSKFTVNDTNGVPVHLNGRLTLGENLADNGG
ncbi:18774_t:CDS:10, partial [Dentiscutata erythropus]